MSKKNIGLKTWTKTKMCARRFELLMKSVNDFWFSKTRLPQQMQPS
jgi:hypothetical protein